MRKSEYLNPLQLWEALVKDAGLELRLAKNKRGRDADLEDEVLRSLDPRAGTATAYGSVKDLIASDMSTSNPSITTERLLIALLQSQSGFGSMMKEILDTLIIAEAKIAEHSLRFSFNFEEQSDPILLTLEEFREQVEHIATVLTSRYQLPDFHMRWDISASLNDFRPKRNSRLAETLSALPPSAPISTNDPSLDELLRILNDLVTEFLLRCSQYGNHRHEIWEAVRNRFPDSEDSAQQAERYLATDATDFWDVNIIESINYITQGVREGRLVAENMVSTLQPLLSNIQCKQAWVEQNYKELLDILNLPTWRKRHELYSVWVGCILLRTVNKYADNIQFHPSKGILSFAFGGSRLASYQRDGEAFDIHTELRSELAGSSTKRKNSIQPDFRVVRAQSSATINDATCLVLECKHYLRSSTRNFSQAANDYARSCQYSSVLIVNHGPIDPASLTALLERDLNQRVRFIGQIHPGHSEHPLKSTLAATLFGTPPQIKSETKGIPDPAALTKGSIATVRLHWDETLQDIDLSLQMYDDDGNHRGEVSFKNAGARSSAPYALLLEDIKQGPGQETIEISRWHAHAYEVFVENYSKTGEFRSGSLHCHIATSFASVTFEFPDKKRGTNKWHVATIIINGHHAIISTDLSR